MDIDRVRYFHVFVETGSLVGASEILHISQPALSKAIKLLEHEVGTKLVEAEGRGLRLTPAGTAFKKETASLLEQWLDVPNRLRLGEAQTPTKIGSFEVFTTYFLSTLTQHIELGALELHEYGPGRLEQAVANQSIDVGITYIPVPKMGVDFIEATKVKMGVFGLKKFKDTPLAELPFVIPILPAEGMPSKIMGLDGWPDHKYPRHVKYRVTMMESAMQLCRQGLAVAYLPSFVVELHNKTTLADYKLCEHQSPVPQKDRLQSVFLIHRKHAEDTTLQRQIAKALRSLS